MAVNKTSRRLKIKKRIRSTVKGTAERPRLTVYRSNKEIYAQLIDDVNGKTLCAFSSAHNETSDNNKVDKAREIGKGLAEKALSSGIEAVVFDRNGYLYHGRVKALAEGAREGGLKF